MWLSLMTVALAEDCDPGAEIVAALSAHLSGDREVTDRALEAAEAAFSCSPPIEPQLVARYWLIAGAVRLAREDREAAADDFAAAKRLAPDLWLPNLPAEARSVWEATAAVPGEGSLGIEPPPKERPVWIDGFPSTGASHPVAAGLHWVQVGDPGGGSRFAKEVWVADGVEILVDTGLPPWVPPSDPAPTDPIEAADPAVRPELYAVTGVGAAFGTALSAAEASEPEAKIAVPIEVGAGIAAGPAVVRLQLGAALLTNGSYLASSSAGEELTMPGRLDLGLAAGLGTRSVRAGLSGGISWPGRIAGRLWAGWKPVGPLYLELRAGGNLPTERPLEPAAELLIGMTR